jgi:prepilin-type N-terminal cleavage/methylation domain-containing protein
MQLTDPDDWHNWGSPIGRSLKHNWTDGEDLPMDNLYNRTARRRRRGQQGFTLIELLVVIAVLAILAGIVIFNVVGVANKGSNASACTDQKSVQTAIDTALNDGLTFAAGDMTTSGAWPKLVPQYLHTGPPGAPGVTATQYGTQTPAWTLTTTGTNNGWTVTNGINGC